MDPFTQGTIGAALPQAFRRNTYVGIAGGLGFLSGMAADLDILIRSSEDTLIYLEYHRQFTHSLIFIPIGGLLMALVLHWLLGRRWKLSFKLTALFCTLGYATHALLDASTSYGTQLLWPFSDTRVAWSIISIIDPLFTLPLFACVVLAWRKKSGTYARVGLAWAAIYLGFGYYQHQSALEMARDLAASRGHQPERLVVKPSIANLVVWKSIYGFDGRYYVDALRVNISPKTYAGESVAKLDIARDFPWLKLDTQQARDIERFRWFSDGYISRDPVRHNRIIDVRYSFVPNEVAALWSIELSKDAAPGDHAVFKAHPRNVSGRRSKVWHMIVGGAQD